MHACGHDLHTAMLLGAAELLTRRKKVLNGQIRLLFQPAEEILEGGVDCVKNGVLSAPTPKCAIMLHALTDLPLPTGTLVVSSEGVSAPAADFFRITVRGKGCHGSTPWKGVDAASVGAHILLALQTLVARELPTSAATVLTVGRLQAGDADNAIADGATLGGTVRTFDEDVRLQVKRRVSEIANAQGKAFHAHVQTKFFGGCPTLVNDGATSAWAYGKAVALLGKDVVFTSAQLQGNEVGKTSGGSEDFAYISREVPSVMVGIAAGERAKGYAYPLHHPKARFDEDALPIGAAFFTALATE